MGEETASNGAVARDFHSNRIREASWFSQLRWAMWKNRLLLTRRPIMLTMMIFSSVISVVLGWLVGRDLEPEDVIYPPLTECGTADMDFLSEVESSSNWEDTQKVKLTKNEHWRSGGPVALMSLGPMINSILVFLIVHNEIHSQLLGVLRALGLAESVYWISWYVPCGAINLLNAISATITAVAVPGNVYDNVYAGGIFASFLLLNLALQSASFFLAAVVGTGRKAFANLVILVMLISTFMPVMMLNIKKAWIYPTDPYSYPEANSRGLFWMNSITEKRDYTCGYDDDLGFNYTCSQTMCNTPLLNEYQGNYYKTEEEQDEVTSEELFVGCYTAPSYGLETLSQDKVLHPLIMFFFPYFHYQSIWGNFAGYSSMPEDISSLNNTGKKFTAAEASLSGEELAFKSFPFPSDGGDKGYESNFAPQFSTFILKQPNQKFYDYQKDYCPNGDNHADINLCSSLWGCVYAQGSAPVKGAPSTDDMFGYLIALSFIYMLCAAYWAQVFSGANGKSQPFYFPFSPSYWFQSSGSSNEEEEDESNSSGIVVKDVKKVYGTFEALKGVSFEMKPGEITALLGHNGAGKSTLSNILCCETAATEGDIQVFGHSVLDEPNVVRKLVGLCKQDDFLWPNLSAREHLELFAGLRGVDRTEIGEMASKWLKSVDLELVQFQYSSAYSGGMKRRLSLALATIGDRPLIVLDEPTTGMDPVSRRFVWHHIDEIKDGRVILLTTHAMEEADLLADEVAIVRKGELAAIGSPLELKSEHGTPLQFSLLVEKEDVKSTKDAIDLFFAQYKDFVVVDAPDTGNVTVKILALKKNEKEKGVDVDKLPKFVAWLDSKESPINEYGFSNSSLEEVFLKVTEGDEEQNATEGQQQTAATNHPEAPEDTDDVPVDIEEGEVNKVNDLSSFTPELVMSGQVKLLLKDFWIRSWTGRGSIGNYFFFGSFIIGSLLLGMGVGSWDDPTAWFFLVVALLSLILVTAIGPMYADRAEGQFYLMQSQGLLPGSYLLGVGAYGFTLYFVYGLLLLTALFASPLFRDFVFCENDSSSESVFSRQLQTSFEPDSNITNIDNITDFDHNGTIYNDDRWAYDDNIWSYNDDYYNNRGCGWPTFGQRGWAEPQRVRNFYDVYEGEQVELEAMRSPGGYGLIIGIVIVYAFTGVGALFTSAFLPGFRIPIVLTMFVVLAAVCWPVVELFKIRDEEDLMTCSNITNPDFVCDGQFFLNSTGTDFLDCVGFEVIQGSWPWLYCIPPHASLLSQFGLFQALAMAHRGQITFVSDTPGYVENVLIPSIDGAGCSGDTCNFPFAKKTYGLNLAYMLVGAVLLTILGLILATFFVFPTGPVQRLRNGLKNLIDTLLCRFTQSKVPSGRNDPTVEECAMPLKSELGEVGEERVEVEKIASAFVEDNSNDDDPHSVILHHENIPRDDVPPVIMHKLRKVYPALGGRPPKVALDSFDLHVRKGEVLGLLGKNGAGKTTALKILAGAHESSGGIGLVGGHDCNLEKTRVFERLGNCAQFDVVWKTRSVQHHLEFFASLKGLPSDQIKDAARSVARAVGLGEDGVYQRNAGDLSGGMRRRLSIAMSLIGAPAVLILDEPTTGLDPSTRSSIWGLISSFATASRSMIITTHMMVEADTLCNRIAIVADGKLKVVATQQSLKDKYGSGYLLQLNLIHSTPEHQGRAMDFVRRRLHPDAELGTRQAKTLHVNLPRDLNLGKVFDALYSDECAEEGCINQFLLSQSSLEDVFVALGN